MIRFRSCEELLQNLVSGEKIFLICRQSDVPAIHIIIGILCMMRQC